MNEYISHPLFNVLIFKYMQLREWMHKTEYILGHGAFRYVFEEDAKEVSDISEEEIE